MKSPENLGFARGNNPGLRFALEHGYDAAYLLNQDAWVEEDTISELVTAAQEHPEFGILSPLQLDAAGAYDAQFAARCRPDPRKRIQEVPYVMAAHWLITRRCLETVGLFAPVFPHYGEDENYCQRVRFHGLRVGVVPSARGVHDRAHRSESLEKVIYRNFTMASLVMLCDIRLPLWMQQGKVLGYAVAKIFRYRSFVHWKQLGELRKQLPDIRRTRSESRKPGAFLS